MTHIETIAYVYHYEIGGNLYKVGLSKNKEYYTCCLLKSYAARNIKVDSALPVNKVASCATNPITFPGAVKIYNGEFFKTATLLESFTHSDPPAITTSEVEPPCKCKSYHQHDSSCEYVAWNRQRIASKLAGKIV